MICPNCGKENVEGAVFCASCGNSLNNVVNNTVNNETTDPNTVKISDLASVDVNDNNVNVSLNSEKINDVLDGKTNIEQNPNMIRDVIGMIVPEDKANEVYDKFKEGLQAEMEKSANNPIPPQPPKKHISIKKIFGICLLLFILLSIIYNLVFVDNVNKDEKTSDVTTTTPTTTSTTTTKAVSNDYDKSVAFLMPVEDIFSVYGRGVSVTGYIKRGTVKVNDEVQLIGIADTKTLKVVEIEKNREKVDSAQAGDPVSIFFEGVDRYDFQRGQVLATPNTIGAHKKFEAEIRLLTKEEGGRHTPIFTNYPPQFIFYNVEITGVIKLPDNVEMVNPGESCNVSIELFSSTAMELGDEFTITEGNRTVGKGTITNIIS